MFALTRKTDYAIIALCHMAMSGGNLCSARDIAERFGMPPALLMNILKTMCQQDLIRSIRGARGGYALAKPANELTLADIISAVEGPIRFFHCVGHQEDEDATCTIEPVCPEKRPAHLIFNRLTSFLRDITLEEIVAESACNTSGESPHEIFIQCEELPKRDAESGKPRNERHGIE